MLPLPFWLAVGTWSVFSKKRFECNTRRGFPFGNGRGGALACYFAALGAPFRTEIDHPVGFCDDVKIVLNYYHGVAGFDELVQHIDELFDIGHVQAHGGFIKDIERVCRAARAHLTVGLGKFRDKLDALRFTA